MNTQTTFSRRLPLFLRLLRHRRALVLGFILVYGLGLTLHLMTASLADSFRSDVRDRAKEVLEGELRIESRRAFTEAEKALLDSLLPAKTRKAEVWGFLSMIRAGDQSSLVQVKAISPEYPLYGSFGFEGDYRLDSLTQGEVLFPKELFGRLGVSPGDSIQLGQMRYKIAARYTDAPGGSLDLFDFGNKIFVPLADIPATGLDKKGSRIFRYRFYELPPGTDVTSLSRTLQRELDDPEMEVTAYTESDSQLGRRFDMVFAFLNITTLAGFLLAALGAAFFFQQHLASEKVNLARMAVMGATPFRVSIWMTAQISALAAAAALFAWMLAPLGNMVLAQAVQTWFGVELSAAVGPLRALETLGIALFTAWALCGAELAQLWRLSPGILLRPREGDGGGGGFPWRYPLLGLYFFALAFWSTRSWMMGALFTAVLLVGFAALAAWGWVLYRLIRARRGLSILWRVSLGELRLHPARSLVAFCSLGMVICFTTLMPGLQALLKGELEAPDRSVVPKLFLFDIQEDQLPGLRTLLVSLGHPLQQVSPMIRARLMAVNGREYAKDLDDKATLEERRDQGFRNRGFNLSYRAELSESEKVVAGDWWSTAERGSQDSPELMPGEDWLPAISLETRFADRLDLKMGDTLLFDVQGVEVAGVVENLREVKWTSFQPNFFALFQPGALEMAPKTFLGTIVGGEELQAEALQTEVVADFPNVTVLNLREIIGRILVILQKMQWLVNLLTSFGFAVGAVMLLLLVRSMVEGSRRALLLLRAAGMSESRLARWQLTQFTLYFTVAGLSGYLLSIGSLFAINEVLWDIPWSPGLLPFLASLALSSSLGLLAGFYAVQRGRSYRMAELLASTRE